MLCVVSMLIIAFINCNFFMIWVPSLSSFYPSSILDFCVQIPIYVFTFLTIIALYYAFFSWFHTWILSIASHCIDLSIIPSHKISLFFILSSPFCTPFTLFYLTLCLLSKSSIYSLLHPQSFSPFSSTPPLLPSSLSLSLDFPLSHPLPSLSLLPAT